MCGPLTHAFRAVSPYTDDLDILSATVHAGRVQWSEVCEARWRGRDAWVEVQVVPMAER